MDSPRSEVQKEDNSEHAQPFFVEPAHFHPHEPPAPPDTCSQRFPAICRISCYESSKLENEYTTSPSKPCLAKADVAKEDIALGDVTGVVRSLLSLGEIGVCLRLLEELEMSSLGLQPLGGKGSNLASKFRQFVRGFAGKDRLSHPYLGTVLLDRWASSGILGLVEEPISPSTRFKQTSPRARRKQDGNISPTISELMNAYQEASSPQLKKGVLERVASSPRQGYYPQTWKKQGTHYHSLPSQLDCVPVISASRMMPKSEPDCQPVGGRQSSKERCRSDHKKQPQCDVAGMCSRPELDCQPAESMRNSGEGIDLHLTTNGQNLGDELGTELVYSRQNSGDGLGKEQTSKRPSSEDGFGEESARSRQSPWDGFGRELNLHQRHPPRLRSPHPEFLAKRNRKQKLLGPGEIKSSILSPKTPLDPASPKPVLTVCSPNPMSFRACSPPSSRLSRQSNNSKLLAPITFGKHHSEPCKDERLDLKGEGEEPELHRRATAPARVPSPCQASSESFSDSSGIANLDDLSDEEVDPGLRRLPKALGRSESLLSLDFDALEADDAEWFATRSHRCMIHPHCNLRLSWDMISLLLILVESVTIPLVIGFDVFVSESWFWFSSVFFACDIVLNMHTGYFSDGLLVMRQSMVVRLYVRGYFLIDLCSTVPWELVFSPEQDCNKGSCAKSFEAARLARIGKVLRAIRLFRLFKLRHLLARIEDMFPSNLFSVTLNLLKVLTLFALLCHWSACVWGYIGNPINVNHPSAGLPPHRYDDCEPGGPCEAGLDGSPWLRRYGYESLGFGTQYLAALHFSVGLVTANEMDIRPGYLGERVYSILLMIISLSVTSIVISQTVIILNKINHGRAEFRERMLFIKEFMRSRKVPIPLQVKVKRYLEYQFKSMTEARAHIGFIENLSTWIRLELTEHLNKSIITRHPFFQAVPSSVVKHFCARAVTVLYAPGDVVVQRGHLASSMGFIIKGKLRIISKNRPQNGSSIFTSPSWIGDISIFVEWVRKFTIISITHSELLTITKEVVMELLNEFPKTRDTFEAFKKKVEEHDFVGCGAQCQHCLQFGHNIADCSRLAKGIPGHLSLPVGAEVTGSRLQVSRETPAGIRTRIEGFFRKLVDKQQVAPPRIQRRRSSGGVAPIEHAEDRSSDRERNICLNGETRAWQPSPCRGWQPSPCFRPPSSNGEALNGTGREWQPSPCPPSPLPSEVVEPVRDTECKLQSSSHSPSPRRSIVVDEKHPYCPDTVAGQK